MNRFRYCDQCCMRCAKRHRRKRAQKRQESKQMRIREKREAMRREEAGELRDPLRIARKAMKLLTKGKPNDAKAIVEEETERDRIVARRIVSRH